MDGGDVAAIHNDDGLTAADRVDLIANQVIPEDQLAVELETHFSRLDLPTLPDGTRRTLAWLVAADPSGLAFRYSGELPDTQDFIDFPKLSKVTRRYIQHGLGGQGRTLGL